MRHCVCDVCVYTCLYICDVWIRACLCVMYVFLHVHECVCVLLRCSLHLFFIYLFEALSHFVALAGLKLDI